MKLTYLNPGYTMDMVYFYLRVLDDAGLSVVFDLISSSSPFNLISTPDCSFKSSTDLFAGLYNYLPSRLIDLRYRSTILVVDPRIHFVF